MAQVTLKGNPVSTVGDLPKVGDQAPDFVLTRRDLADISLKDVAGKKVVLNIFPSIDTEICAMSVRRFNAEVDQLENTVVICASLDLPFAHERFCGAEGLENVVSVSELRDRDFGNRYGIRIADGPLTGLLARAVVILDENGKVTYTQLVPEITDEPNYEDALETLKR